MKKEYQKPKIEIKNFENEDIVTLSTLTASEQWFDSDWAE